MSTFHWIVGPFGWARDDYESISGWKHLFWRLWQYDHRANPPRA